MPLVMGNGALPTLRHLGQAHAAVARPLGLNLTSPVKVDELLGVQMHDQVAHPRGEKHVGVNQSNTRRHCRLAALKGSPFRHAQRPDLTGRPSSSASYSPSFWLAATIASRPLAWRSWLRALYLSSAARQWVQGVGPRRCRRLATDLQDRSLYVGDGRSVTKGIEHASLRQRGDTARA